MRIVFMGTPDYALKTLKALYEAGHEIAAVFCQPDKPVGRKQILTAPPVKVFAIEKGISVFQPVTLKSEEIQNKLKKINPDIIAVVAYGKILPQEILDIPRIGCVNGHGSILPKLRGASPIQWAIVTGEKVTGVTTMFMDKGMDTGDILETAETKIGEKETAEELFERMGDITAELMVSTIAKLEKGEITPTKQNSEKATYAPIIKKEMAHLNFNESAMDVYNKIKGFYSWPSAYFTLDGKRVKVLSAQPSVKTEMAAGTVTESDKHLCVACGDGNSIEFLVLQPEGKKPMSAEVLLNGYKIPKGKTVNQDA